MPVASSIRVGVRSRPLAYNELRDGCQSCISLSINNDIIIGGSKQFTFDHVFGDHTTQEELYKNSVRDLINNLFLGYNVTVIAYGQTGSGKTYTMGTNFTDKTITPNSGVIPRAIKDIYDYLDQIKEKAVVSVRVSFIEVYNEEIFDLLSENKELRLIREENQENKIQNLIELTVKCAEDIFKCLMKGSENRAVGSTAMNETSSRSHAIFTIYINILPNSQGDYFEPINSKLHLVDLAGSERASKTLATGDRFKEGVNINKGLLVLGNVISSLVEKDKEKNKIKNIHVPYRESKLTRLLQDSLGGNAKTLMLACISPADSNFEETSTTLNYAARARQIQNKPVINKPDSVQEEVYQLRAKVTALETQLRNIQGDGAMNVVSSLSPNVSTSYFSQICELNAKIVEIQRQKLELIEEFDEEISKKDDILKKVWENINVDTMEKNVYLELEKVISDISAKEEHVDILENSVNTEIEVKCESNEKSNMLRNLREELKNKEAYLQQIENTDHSILQHYEEKNRELLQRIKELEEEKLKNSSKTKQDAVELNLKEVRKQLNELNAMKKEKEQTSNEVRQLKCKIDELKKSIFKVTKELQKEKTMFRKITEEKDKQCKYLLHKDRQWKSQLERQAIQHAKETAVLRRKVESCSAEGKRLKDILDKRKKFNSNRVSRNNMNKNMSSQVKLWIRQSLEQAAERCETRQRFNQLIEDRRKLNEQLCQFMNTDNEEKSQLETEIKRLNDCISQLQQTELSESVNDMQVLACWNQLRNINECRVAIRYMFKQLVEERVNHVMAESELQDVRTLNSVLEQVNGTLHNELQQIRLDNEKQLRRSLAVRRTSSVLLSAVDIEKGYENSKEPALKKQRLNSQKSDNESVTSAYSTKSRMSSRLSQACRCKSSCKPNRCGCLKSGESCSSKCLCQGLCLGISQPNLDDIAEDNSESLCKSDNEIEGDCKGNLNTTFNNDEIVLRRSFTLSSDHIKSTNLNIPIIDDDDDDKENNQTITNTDITLTEFHHEKKSRTTYEKYRNQKNYFDSPSLISK